ncbi:helix-turn-helix transcriptional regulator [Actinorugispora endophytica]|uniref:Putative ArsR family transcriptional regulator n=1 Tax=Actinorugispora endophytica TaxID=1605990 RepID=A0A4R6V456_9ACTN|nr:helix-turn-helix domain-containing protein [Actinorugispora endophytica]TDQ54963.1 putative ArsR family transcriptional regulator [Actinorugispora endophytica]
MSETEIDAIGALADPVRRRLYEYVAARGGETTRAEAAEATGLQRTLVAFHLDKLVEAGLLEAAGRKAPERRGPGSGRPAKVYRRSARQIGVQLPPRDYETAAHLLAEAVERSGAEDSLYEAARAEGARRGAADPAPEGVPDEDALREHLARFGYEPADDADSPGTLRLRNCPFHTLARAFPPLACGMNLELLSGLLAGSGAEGFTARMAPRADGCCVAISKNKID